MVKNRGSAIVWAVCTMLVLGILAAAILAVGQRYSDGGLRSQLERQARLSAQGAVDAMLAELDGYCFRTPVIPGSSAALDVYLERVAADNPLLGPEAVAVDFDPAGFPLPGTIDSAQVARAGADVWRVSATATVEGVSQTASARLRVREGAPLGDGPVAAARVFSGFYAPQITLLGGRCTLNLSGGDAMIGQLLCDEPGAVALLGGSLYTGMTLEGAGRERALVDSLGQRVATATGADGYFGGTHYRPAFDGSGTLSPSEGRFAAVKDGDAIVPQGAVSFFAVNGRASLDLMHVPGDRVVLVTLGPGAELTVTGGAARLYTYGSSDSTVILVPGDSASGRGRVALSGALVGSRVVVPGKGYESIDASIDYSVPPDDLAFTFEGGEADPAFDGFYTFTWSFECYE